MRENGNPETSDDLSSLIDLTVTKRGDTLLYVLIHSDGTVNRMGTINGECSATADGPMVGPVIGMTERPLFDELVSALTPELVQWIGQHDLGGDGESCKLTLTIALGGRGGRVEFTYGASAPRVPESVRDFVQVMVRISDGWLAESSIGFRSDHPPKADRRPN